MSESVTTATEEAISKLTDGSLLHKIRGSHKFYRRKYQIDTHNMLLSYKGSQKRYFCKNVPNDNVELENIAEIRTGLKSDNFNKIGSGLRRKLQIKKLPDVNQDTCFSLVFENDAQTVDFVAPDMQTRDLWVKGIEFLIASNKNQKKENQNEYFLKKQFRDSDKNGNGSLNLEEVLALLNRLNVSLDKKHVIFLFDSANFRRNKDKLHDESLDEEEFYELYRLLTTRPKMNEIFERYAYHNSSIMCAEKLMSFFKKEQKNSEITLTECQDIIRHLESEETQVSDFLSCEGMNLCDLNMFNSIHRNICQDMSQPLSHYYIASSHNTYLINGQLYGDSSIEGYRIALLKGCRCVELDVWDGKSEPIVYHGHTLTTKVTFKDVIELIKEYAFRTSEYPVILSIENHCHLQQQQQMASIMIDILGDYLLRTPLSQNETVWPSPQALKKKIIIKGKRLPSIESLKPSIDSPKDEFIDHSTVLEALAIKNNIAIELSNIITYCVSRKFKSFEECDQNWNFYEMSSFVETEHYDLAQKMEKELIEFNTKHLSRIYPKGLRTDSSNYNPIPHWNVGSQLVALNYQTHSKPMLLNDALFSLNGKCGYVLKPKFLRKDELKTDINKAKKLIIHIISGQHLPKPGLAKDGEVVDPYVKVKIYGHNSDKQSFKTKFVKNNGFNPIWDESFEFLVRFPELAFIYFVVKDHCGKGKDMNLGQYLLSFNAITQGYRNIDLNDERNQPITSANLFVKITLQDL